MRAKLFVVGGRAQKKELEIELPARVGRSDEADLTIVHPTVSRRHCELFARDGELIVRDTGSTNGILVRGNRITESVLHPDDEFTIGPLTFRAAFCDAPSASSDESKSPGARGHVTPAAIGSNGKNGSEVDELDLPELDEDDAGHETLTLPEPEPEEVAEIEAIEPATSPEAPADDEALDELLPDLGDDELDGMAEIDEPAETASDSMAVADDGPDVAPEASASLDLDADEALDELLPDLADEDLPDFEDADSPASPAIANEAEKIASGSTADEEEEAVAELLPELGDEDVTDVNVADVAATESAPSVEEPIAADSADEDDEVDLLPLDAEEDVEVDLLPLDTDEDAEVGLLSSDQDAAADATLDFEDDVSEELLSLDDADELTFETETPAPSADVPPAAKPQPAGDAPEDAATPPDISFDDEDSAELIDFLPAADDDAAEKDESKNAKAQDESGESDDPDLDMFLKELE